MKKLTASILTVLLLLSLLVACNTETPNESSVVPNESSEVMPNESSEIPNESSTVIPDDSSQPDDKPKEIHEYFGGYGNIRYGKIYYITEQEHFENFAMLVEKGIYDFKNDTVCLTIDISLEQKYIWNPIGSKEFPFRGTFVGAERDDDHYNKYLKADRTISGLYFTIKESALFDTVEYAYIGNITVDQIKYVENISDARMAGIALYATDSTISSCVNNSDISDKYEAAGIVFDADNTEIVDCINNGDITSSAEIISGAAGIAYNSSGTIEAARNYGNISAKAMTAAGISAYHNGMLIGCRNDGDINGGQDAAGIVADEATTTYIIRCVNTGDVTAKETAGGIIGWACDEQGTLVIYVDSCLNTGKITATESAPIADDVGTWAADTEGAGGIVGGFEGSVAVHESFTVKNCLNIGTVECEYQSGAIIGNEKYFEQTAQSYFLNCYYLKGCVDDNEIGTSVSESRLVDYDKLNGLLKRNWYVDEELGCLVPYTVIDDRNVEWPD